MFRNYLDTAEELELADALHPDDVMTLIRLQLQQMRDEAAEYDDKLNEDFSDFTEALDRLMESITAVVRQEQKDKEDGYDSDIDRSSSTTVALTLAMHMLQGQPEAIDIVEEELLENAQKRAQQPQSRGRFEEVELQRRQTKPHMHDRGF